jgi:DNA-binding transcriptional MerR regulator
LRVREMLRIGELAGLAGTTPNAVRFYHEAGLLEEPERSEAGYRLYDESDLFALGRVLRLRSLGLSVPRVRDVLEGRLALDAALKERLEELGARISELETERERVAGALRADEEDLLDGTPPARPSLPEELEFEDEADEEEARRERERLGGYAQRIERILLSFRWPTRYLGLLRDLGNEKLPRDADPETKRRQEELAQRWFALYELPEDDPEVERLVGEFLQAEQDYPLGEEELNETFERLFRRHGIPKGDPVLRAAKSLFVRSFSPSQRRFARLYRERKREMYGEDASILGRTLEEWLGERPPGRYGAGEEW